MSDTRKMSRERDRAFIDFVTTGRWNKVEKYMAKYGVNMPPDRRVAAAGIYKATLQCTRIPVEVKALAAAKCTALGFSTGMGGRR